MTRPCKHPLTEIVTLRDFKREQRCTDCGAVVFRLPPANPTHAELRAEAERRDVLLTQGWPFTRNPPTP